MYFDATLNTVPGYLNQHILHSRGNLGGEALRPNTVLNTLCLMALASRTLRVYAHFLKVPNPNVVIFYGQSNKPPLNCTFSSNL